MTRYYTRSQPNEPQLEETDSEEEYPGSDSSTKTVLDFTEIMATEETLLEQMKMKDLEITRMRTEMEKLQSQSTDKLKIDKLILPEDVSQVKFKIEFWEMGLPTAISSQEKKRLLVSAMAQWSLSSIFIHKMERLKEGSYEDLKQLIFEKIKQDDVQILFSPNSKIDLYQVYTAAKKLANTNDKDTLLRYLAKHVTSDELMQLKLADENSLSRVIRTIAEAREDKTSPSHKEVGLAEIEQLKKKIEQLQLNSTQINAMQSQQIDYKHNLIDGTCYYHRSFQYPRTCIRDCKKFDSYIFKLYDAKNNIYYKPERNERTNRRTDTNVKQGQQNFDPQKQQLPQQAIPHPFQQPIVPPVLPQHMWYQNQNQQYQQYVHPYYGYYGFMPPNPFNFQQPQQQTNSSNPQMNNINQQPLNQLEKQPNNQNFA